MVAYNVIGLVFCILAFGLSSLVTFSADWVHITSDESGYSGKVGQFYACLKRGCYSKGAIHILLDNPALRTAFVFNLFSTLFAFIIVILIAVGTQKKCQKKLRRGGILALFTVLIQLIAIILYKFGQNLAPHGGSTYEYGFSYKLGWVLPIVTLIGGIFSLIESKDGETSLMGRFRILSTRSSSVEKV